MRRSEVFARQEDAAPRSAGADHARSAEMDVKQAVAAGRRCSLGYAARLLEGLARNDPRMMLIGRAESDEAKRLLSVSLDQCEHIELRHAKRVVAGSRHPEGHFIPRALRPSAFPWMNVPLVVGFLWADTAISLIVLQVINQTFNASFNLANGARGGVNGARKRVVFGNFVAATLVACAVAVAGHAAAELLSVRNPLIGWAVPYASVVSADVVNVCLSRREEYVQGVPITDEHGKRLGISRAAGRAAVAKTLLTRSLLLPLVALLVPTLLTQPMRMVLPSWYMCEAWEVFCVAVTLAVGLPVCTALFPETLCLPLARLEPRAQQEVRQSSSLGPVPKAPRRRPR